MKLPFFVKSRIIRRKLRVDETPINRFRIRVAQTADDYWAAFRLVQAAYVSLGIENALESPVRITDQHVLPEAYVLIAEEGDRVVASATLTLDSPAGLPLDKNYRHELDAMRRQGLRLCELGSLAVVGRVRRSGITNLLNIAAFTLATQRLAADRVVIGVHPRAAEIFQATCNFSPLGPVQTHAQLVAPVAGMSVDLHTLKAFLLRVYPNPLASGFTAAEHFFGAPLDCITLPVGPHASLTRWKQSREVFQELFLRRTNRINELEPSTREYLEMSRTPRTLNMSNSVRLRALQAQSAHR